ncbi:MAG TPA: heparan-alpha-glucosaminide N-acetyltransferase domain-containing protein [Terriglobales bacterium]|nr:heparan-alpha-glucosaminide N-acetyltransferase domain-containing protein [Terriglobales bacterium]
MSISAPSVNSTAAPGSLLSSRIVSLDVFRGLIMVVMALDHTRDFFTNVPFEPETIAQTWPALFFTRWITHFCAPMFFLLAGTGAYLYGHRRTPADLTRFLWTRGLWLIALEFTVVGTAWSFQIPFGFFGVIWALGASMVLMAAIVRLPMRWIAGLSAVMILFHDLLDGVRPVQFGSLGWVWSLLHHRGGVMLPFGVRQFVLFPLIPLVGVMAAGYVLGQVYTMERARRKKLLVLSGTIMITLFVFLRLTNLYGNPPAGLGGVSQGDFHVQPTFAKTVMLFFDVEKYPPSLQFLLMTVGPSLLLLAWLDRESVPIGLKAVWTFGRVPMFFYVLHLYVIHTLAIVVAALRGQPLGWLFHGAIFGDSPAGYGYNLPFVYCMWITAVALLYFPCRWFAKLKKRRREWWLSYL